MVLSDSYGTFRMHSPGERFSWACYQLFVALSAIMGDSLILIASSRKDSFKLNSFLVAIMRHIAVCDIAISVVHILPCAVSLIADTWVLGDTLCSLKPFMTYYFFPTNMSMICILTTGKFLLLTGPLWARNLSSKQGHVICSAMWLLSLVYPGLMFVLGKQEDISFDFRTYSCECGWNALQWLKVKSVLFVVIAVIPNAVVILTTIPTLRYLVAARTSAKRSRVSVPWQGALTVFLTAVVYCLSTLPGTVYLIVAPFVVKDTDSTDLYRFHLLYRYGMFVAMMNITSNFFIYTLTITSFRRYLYTKIAEITAFQTSPQEPVSYLLTD